MLVGQIRSITQADYAATGFVAQHIGWKYNRHHNRFEIARWQIDNQPCAFAATDTFQLIKNGVHVPILEERRIWIESVKGAPQEAHRIDPYQGIERRHFG